MNKAEINMKIVLVAPFVSEPNYKRLQAKLNISNPGQKFYMLLYKGLLKNNVCTKVFSIVPKEFEPYIEKDDFEYYFIRKKRFGFINIDGASDELARMIDKDTIIIADGEAYWTLVVSLKQKCRVINLITDFPHHVASYSSSNKKRGIVYRKIYQLYAKYYKLYRFKKADGFIFLTKYMSEVIGKSKPFVVIEGFTDSDYLPRDKTQEDMETRTICYLGALNDKSGIMNLIEAFKRIKDDDLQLNIYGSGVYVDSIKHCDDERVHYMGVVSLEEVEKVERDSNYLINPRPSKDDYNKYSFPSKTLEYMLSGTPVITTKLAGIPDEYDDYLFYLDDSSIEEMSTNLQQILNLPVADLATRAKAAQQFAFESKNNIVQAKKIIDFVSGFR
ncbi:MAG: glycosyltransferase family 4 protein [Clostridiales bacterium]|nr:glycosyltransferase family 4 protein [Clostridiales bacterium]